MKKGFCDGNYTAVVVDTSGSLPSHSPIPAVHTLEAEFTNKNLLPDVNILVVEGQPALDHCGIMTKRCTQVLANMFNWTEKQVIPIINWKCSERNLCPGRLL